MKMYFRLHARMGINENENVLDTCSNNTNQNVFKIHVR